MSSKSELRRKCVVNPLDMEDRLHELEQENEKLKRELREEEEVYALTNRALNHVTEENEKLIADVAMLRNMFQSVWVVIPKEVYFDKATIDRASRQFSATASSDAWLKNRISMLLDEIDDFCSDALQSDLENGVKWLNEEAAKEFHSNYPNIAEALGKAGRMAAELRSTGNKT